MSVMGACGNGSIQMQAASNGEGVYVLDRRRNKWHQVIGDWAFKACESKSGMRYKIIKALNF